MKKIYIAIPYTGQEQQSYLVSTYFQKYVIENGNVPISPITMSHSLVECVKTIDNEKLAGDWEFWQKIDLALIDVSDEVWVINLNDKMNKSIGVNAEIEYAKEKNIPIKYYNFIYPNIFREFY